jgi:uncharacterized protein YeaO (DUF488 family)
MKDLAPSDRLRKWFKHSEGRWPEFRRRYADELAAPERRTLLEEIAEMSRKGNVTLLYASRNREMNNAVVVQHFASDLAAKEGSKR